jgi:hypothetical protein
MVQLAQFTAKYKRFDPIVVLGFLLPICVAVLIGMAIYSHSRPIQAPITETTDSSGGVTSTAPANPPTAAEITNATAAILSYCQNDLRQDTSCTLVANSNKTAPGYVESGLTMSGQFASDGNSSAGIAIAKGSGSNWTVIWVGQNCVPKDTASQDGIPITLSVCST